MHCVPQRAQRASWGPEDQHWMDTRLPVSSSSSPTTPAFLPFRKRPCSSYSGPCPKLELSWHLPCRAPHSSTHKSCQPCLQVGSCAQLVSLLQCHCWLGSKPPSFPLSVLTGAECSPSPSCPQSVLIHQPKDGSETELLSHRLRIQDLCTL